MSDNITIERMAEADCQNVYDLGISTKELRLDENNPVYYSIEKLINFTKSLNGICLVAKADGKFAGYIIAALNPDLKESYLIDIVVAKKYRKLGIGKKLFETALKKLKDRQYVWTWGIVRDTNSRMQKFIESMGFKKGELFNVYYKSL